MSITFYDLETLIGTLSPFAWRARMGLNYKKLKYETEWLTLVKIKPTFEKLGIPETPNHPMEKSYYTVPALIDSSTTPPTIVSQSPNILKYIDEKVPEPPLYAVRPSGCSDAEWERISSLLIEVDDFLDNKVDQRWLLIFGFFLPGIPSILKEEDIPYFKESRVRWFQKSSWEEVGHRADVAEARLADFNAALDTLDKIYEKGQGKPYSGPGDKPWLLGDAVSRADFAMVGFFLLIAGAAPQVWEKMQTWNNGRWARMVELSAEWRF